MPRYDYDPTAATASIEIFSKGDYELEFGEPKSFIKDGEKGQNWGIRYPVVVRAVVNGGDPNAKGKRTFYPLYLHTEGSQGFAKQALMAAYGYNPRSNADEQAFNEEVKGLDWGYDPDTGTCGDMWHSIKGRRAICSLDVQPNKNKPDEMMQQFGTWRPLEGAPRG